MQQLLARTDQYGNRQVPQELEEIILKAIQPDKAKRYGSAEQMSKALQGIKILSVDTHLDQMFQSLSTKYPPPLFGTGDSKRYSSWRSYLYVNGKTSGGLALPEEITNFMDELALSIKRNPDRLTDVLLRFDALDQKSFSDKDLKVLIHTRIGENVLTLTEEYIQKYPTRNAEPGTLDILERIFQNNPNVGDRYGEILLTVSKRDTSRLDELIARCYNMNISFEFDNRIKSIVDIIMSGMQQNIQIEAKWTTDISHLVLSETYPPPLFGTGDSKRYSSWRSYLYVNGKTNVGLLLPGAMQTTLNFMEKLLQQSSTRQLALDTLQDMKKQTMPQFALERLFDTRIEEILQKFQSQQKRIISP